jgi:hypothetical protein
MWPARCILKAERAAELIQQHALQTLRELRRRPQLAAISAERSSETAQRNQVTHAFGVTPRNRRLCLPGYSLQPHCSRGWDNQVEAVAGG